MPPHQLTVAPLVRLPDLLAKRRIAAGVAAPNLSAEDRALPEVAYLQDLDAEVGEDGEQVLPPTADPVVTSIVRIALRREGPGGELHVGVDHLEEGVEVPPVQGLVGGTGSLHVLLRHRPRSIPRLSSDAE